MRALILATAFFAQTAHAQGEKSLRYGPNGTYSEARVHIFVDDDQPPPHCPCYRFTFAVDDAQTGEIRDEKVVMWIVDPETSGGIRGSHVLDLTPVYTHPESPTKTVQTIFRVPYTTAVGTNDMQFQFITMRKKCKDPARAECNEYVTSIQGSFAGRQLLELTPVVIGDLFESN